MKKSFRAFLIEQEKDYTYEIVSVANIHDAGIISRISQALAPYGLLEVEKGYFKPIQKTNAEFPAYPDSATYSVKVTLSTAQRDSTILQAVALFTNISDKNLKVNGDEKMPDVEPKEETPGDIAGEKRIGALLRDLEKERKEREAQTDTKGIDFNKYERFVTNHAMIEGILGRKLRRGYYLVETAGAGKKVTVTGPFKKQPSNYEFRETMVEGLRFLSESTDNGRALFEFDASSASTIKVDKPSRQKSSKWEVDVLNNDSGKTETVYVNAPDEVTARNVAVDTVRMRTGVDSRALIATGPEK